LQRINMGIVVVCMVDSRNHSRLLLPHSNSSSLTNGKFNWPKSTQGFVLASFFFGYIFTLIPSGWLSMRYGPKLILAIGVLGTSLTTFLSAPAATLHVYALILVRFICGLFHVIINFVNDVYFQRLFISFKINRTHKRVWRFRRPVNSLYDGLRRAKDQG
jgi:MFS family permease